MSIEEEIISSKGESRRYRSNTLSLYIIDCARNHNEWYYHYSLRFGTGAYVNPYRKIVVKLDRYGQVKAVWKKHYCYIHMDHFTGNSCRLKRRFNIFLGRIQGEITWKPEYLPKNRYAWNFTIKERHGL